MQVLTEIQQAVYNFVRERLLSGSSAPSQQEICKRFGWKSNRAAECHLAAIIHKGWLTSEPGKARSLSLTNEQRQPTFQIPIYGSIPAGHADDRAQESDESITLDVNTLGFKPTRNTIALRVSGDSMIGKFIIDGDIVVLEHGVEPREGQIVAALIDGRSTLKTFLVKRGKPYLQAENPDYPDQIPAHELMIQGVFRTLIRQSRD